MPGETEIEITVPLMHHPKHSNVAQTESRTMKRAKEVGNTILGFPRAIIRALSKAVYWVWANGIQITGSYPNGKKDAENLTAKKVFNQLVGFVFSTIATTLVRLAHIAIYVALAAPYFFAVYALISLAPIAVPAAAGLAALTVLTSPFIVNTILGSASKAFWENPSNKINAVFFDLINKKIGNESKVDKGFEFDYIGRLFHKMGYQASDYVLSLPGKAYSAAFGVEKAAGKAYVSPESPQLEEEEEEVKNESSPGLDLGSNSAGLQWGGRPRTASEQKLIDLPEEDFGSKMVRVYTARAAKKQL